MGKPVKIGGVTMAYKVDPLPKKVILRAAIVGILVLIFGFVITWLILRR